MTKRGRDRRRHSPSRPPAGSTDVRAAPSQSRRGLRYGAIIVVLAALDLTVYAQLGHHDFITLDDSLYVTRNSHVLAGLTWLGVVWAFASATSPYWQPLAWWSHMFDVQLFGMRAGPQHLMSLVLHVLNTILLFLLLQRLTGATLRSAIVAALFGVHPLHVESVAWLAERKDVLSTFFWWLTMWAYVSYVRDRRWTRYVAVIVSFALGLMAKPMLVTLPLALLLIDVWPLRRLQNVSLAGLLPLVREKLPLFAMSLAAAVTTFINQRSDGAVVSAVTLPVITRVGNASVSYVAYLAKAFWPTHLVVFYPDRGAFAWAQALGSIAVLATISVLAIRAARTQPYLTVGWLWYFVTLLPVIGFIQVGDQAMADRFTYVPLVGIFIMMVWGLSSVPIRWPAQRAVLAGVAAAAVLACTVVAHAQAAWWQDDATLWGHALIETPDNYMAQYVVGGFALDHGAKDEAHARFAESVRLNPGFAPAHSNLGVVLMDLGRLDDAVAECATAVRMNPRDAKFHSALGLARAMQGQRAEAAREYDAAVTLAPQDADVRLSYAQALALEGRRADATSQNAAAVTLAPTSAVAHYRLAVALAAQGTVSDAVVEFGEAIRLNPALAEAHANLGTVFFSEGAMPDAIREYSEAIRIEPSLAVAWNNRGNALAMAGRLPDAIHDFLEAIRLAPDLTGAHLSLARAFEATGSPADALREITEALRLEPDNKDARESLLALTHSMAAKHKF